MSILSPKDPIWGKEKEAECKLWMSIKMNTSNGLETLGFLCISVSSPASARHRVEEAAAILKLTTKDISVCQSYAF